DGALRVWSPISQIHQPAASVTSVAKKSKKAAQATAASSLGPQSKVAIRIVAVDKNNNLLPSDQSEAPRFANILNASFSTASADAIIIAYGSFLRPTFERISVLKRDVLDNVGNTEQIHVNGFSDNTDSDTAVIEGPVEFARAEKSGKFIGLGELAAKQLVTRILAFLFPTKIF
ncbi:hypothetical protein HK100_007802, partial [Physocladia obscura]